jgi:hypothetical protein
MQTQKKSRLKIIAALAGGLVALVILGLLLTPSLLSTTSGNRWLTKKMGERVELKIEVKTLSLSWFGSQSAKEIRAQRSKDELSFTCEEISIDASLLKLLFFKDLDLLTLKKPTLELAGPLTQPVSGVKSPLKVAGLSAAPLVQLAMPTIDLPLEGKIVIEAGKMGLRPKGGTSAQSEPIVFDQIDMEMDLKRDNNILLLLTCITREQQNQGAVSLKGTASEFNSSFPHVELRASVSNLPVRGVDSFVALFFPEYSGLIYAMVGPTLDIDCDTSVTLGNIALDLSMKSPQITAQLSTQMIEGMVSLKNPAQLNCTLTPQLFQKLAALSPSFKALELKQPALIQGTLSQFSCKVPMQASDLLSASFQAEWKAPPELLFSLEQKPLIISHFVLKTNSPSLEKEIAVSATAATQTQGETGTLAVEGTLSKFFSENPGVSLSVNASKLPSAWIGLAMQAQVEPAALLGPTFDLKAALNMQQKEPQLHLSWLSALLSIPSLDLSLGNPITLTSAAPFVWKLSPELMQESTLQLGAIAPLEGVLNTLSIPRGNIKNAKLSATLNTGPITTTGTLPLSFSKLKALLEVNTLDQVSLEIEGDPLKASISGAYRPSTSAFVLNKPLRIEYLLNNALLSALVPDAPSLESPIPLQLLIQPTSLPLSGFDLRELSLKGQLLSPTIALGTAEKKITFQNTTVPFEWNAKAKTANIQLTTHIQDQKNTAGSIQGALNISNFSSEKGVNFNSATIQALLDVQNISSSLLDTFYTKAPLSAILGPTFSSKLKLQSSSDKQNITLKWVSPLLNVDSTFIVDSAGVRLQGAATQIQWILTQDSYGIFDAMITGANQTAVPFKVDENSTFTLSLSKLSLPILPKKDTGTLTDRIPEIAFDLAKLQLNASGKNPSLTFFDKRSKETIQLANIAFSLDKNANAEPLALSLESGVMTQAAASTAPQSLKNGSLTLMGTLTPTLDQTGVFDLSKLTCQLQIKAKQLPARSLDIIARAQGRTDFPFSTLFGDMINAQMTADLKNFAGPIDLKVNTPMTRIDLNGNLANGALFLNNALYVQMKITPEMSRLVLKEVNPLNLSYVYSHAPITLEIPAKGFYLPLYPSNLGTIAIPEATLELGKIVCRNEGNVNVALSLLKTKQFDKSGELLLWFAPVDFRVKKGIVDIERTEILLADTFDICIWGTFDLIKNYVDMILGLTAQTLNRAFGVKNLPENYVLTIPMKGPADNVKIDTSKATSKVTLLLAWQSKILEGALKNTPGGALFGEVMGKMATLPDSNAKVPPAKHPFPWETSRGGRTSDASHHQKKRQFKANEKPLKQILKVIR